MTTEPSFSINALVSFDHGLLLHPSSQVGPKPVRAGLSGHGVTVRLESTGSAEAAIHSSMASIEKLLPAENAGVLFANGGDDIGDPDFEVRLDDNPLSLRQISNAVGAQEPLTTLRFAPVTKNPQVVRWQLWIRVECAGELYTSSFVIHTTASTHMMTFEPGGGEGRPTSAAEMAPRHWHPEANR